MEDYYNILGLDRNCSAAEIKKRFRELAFIHHPDKNKGSKKHEEKFKIILKAYEVLIDKVKRAEYDFHFKMQGNKYTSVPETPVATTQEKSFLDADADWSISPLLRWAIILIVINVLKTCK